jgi:hypothetical protein
VQVFTENVNLRMQLQYINTEILVTEMGVSNEAKNIIPLKFLRKTLVNSIRGHIIHM